jgi:hypothetical protein
VFSRQIHCPAIRRLLSDLDCLRTRYVLQSFSERPATFCACATGSSTPNLGSHLRNSTEVSLILLDVTGSPHRDQDGKCTRDGFVEIEERAILDLARQPQDNSAWAFQVIDHSLYFERDVLPSFQSLHAIRIPAVSAVNHRVFFTDFTLKLPKGLKTCKHRHQSLLPMR